MLQGSVGRKPCGSQQGVFDLRTNCQQCQSQVLCKIQHVVMHRIVHLASICIVPVRDLAVKHWTVYTKMSSFLGQKRPRRSLTPVVSSNKITHYHIGLPVRDPRQWSMPPCYDRCCTTVAAGDAIVVPVSQHTVGVLCFVALVDENWLVKSVSCPICTRLCIRRSVVLRIHEAVHRLRIRFTSVKRTAWRVAKCECFW
jgi:fumarate reductase subunit D